MLSKQKGMTGIGMMCIAALIAVIALAGFKVVPFYIEMTKVYTILDDLERDYTGSEALSPANLRTQLDNRINIESVYGLNAKDFEIKRTQDGYNVSIQYAQEVHYLANLYLVVKYDKTVEILR